MESKDPGAQGAPTTLPKGAQEEGGYIKEKSLVVVRMKPVGVGEVDEQKKLTLENKYKNKEYVGCSHEKHCVTFKDLGTGKILNYDWPDLVATDDYDNKRMFNETIGSKI